MERRWIGPRGRVPTSAEVDAWIGSRHGHGFDQQLQSAISEAKVMMESGKWEGVTSIHLLAVHRIRYQEVYVSTSSAVTEKMHRYLIEMVKKHFADDAIDFVCFLRWIWEREEARVRSLRAAGEPPTRRLTVRRLFDADLLKSYRDSLGTPIGVAEEPVR